MIRSPVVFRVKGRSCAGLPGLSGASGCLPFSRYVPSPAGRRSISGPTSGFDEPAPDAPEPAGPPERRTLKYRRIADDLRAGIRAGEYRPGRPLPGENDLMARYAVARMTVRQALAELQREGLAVARRGSGVYVSDFTPIVRDQIGRLTSAPWARGQSIWSAEAGARDLQVDELDVSAALASEGVAAALGLSPGDPVWVRSRRFVLDRRRVMLSVSWLPAEIVDGTAITTPDTGPGGTYARLAELGFGPTRFREDVRARSAGPEEAERLGLSPSAPVLALTRYAYAGDRPVELNEMVLDAAVYVLRYDFDAAAPAVGLALREHADG
jgi:GntR family transcriptional regulator